MHLTLQPRSTAALHPTPAGGRFVAGRDAAPAGEVGNRALLPLLALGVLLAATPLAAQAGGPQPWLFIAHDVVAAYDPATGQGSIQLPISIAEQGALPGLQDTQGFSMGIVHDPTYLIPASATALGPLGALHGGMGPDYFAFVSSPANGPGVVLGVVYDFISDSFIPFPAPQVILQVNYITQASTLIGDLDGASTPISWSNQLGFVFPANTVVVSGLSQGVDFAEAVITLNAGAPFVRGDCNASGTVNLTDVIGLLFFLFPPLGGPPPTVACADACDANDSGTLNLTDPVVILNYLFGMPSIPLPPPQQCANDPSGDLLACDSPICP